ncbi:MAG: hypothetical protein AAGE52_31355 [Myxococcota bacterium]
MRALLVLVLLGCGGGGDAGPNPNSTVPLSWHAGERTAAIFVDRQAKNPATLEDDRCGLFLQLGEATADGQVPRTDAEGPCIVTDAEIEFRGQPGIAPFCGGTLQVQLGGFDQTLTVCETIPDRIELDCADVDAGPAMRIVSRAGETTDDVLGDSDVTHNRGRVLDLQSPEPQGDGTALWPEGELLLGWGGSGGSSVEIVLRARDGGGPAVRCFVDDTGSFVVPERLASMYRGQIATVEVARVTQTVFDDNGVEVRISDRISDAVWLFP